LAPGWVASGRGGSGSSVIQQLPHRLAARIPML
jgi:hypothetical protein